MASYLAEISIVSFNFAPKGYALCNGQTLPINQNQALFSLLGTFYGGNGQTTFKLPDLQGRIPLHWSDQYPLGSSFGEEGVLLTNSTMPDHSHTVQASLAQYVGGTATETSPINALPADATAGSPRYNSKADDQMVPITLSQMVPDPVNHPLTTAPPVGPQQPVPNLMPSLALTYIIAIQGIFPTRP